MSGNLFVKDYVYFIEQFKGNGDFIRSLKFPHTIHDFFPDNEGNFFILLCKFNEVGHVHQFCKVDTDGNIIRVIAEHPYTKYLKHLENGYRFTVTTGHELSIKFTKLNDKEWIYGYSQKYELNIINLSGKIIRKIKKDESPPKFTKIEKEIFKKIGIPEYKPYFYSILVDDLGHIYIQRDIVYRDDYESQNRVDIFPSERSERGQTDLSY